MHVFLRKLVDEIHASLFAVGAYLVFLAGVVALVVWLLPERRAIVAGADPDQKSEWSEAARPQPAFALEGATLASTDPHYTILRNPEGGRQDIMTWGTPEGTERYLRIAILRPAAGEDGGAFDDGGKTLAHGEVPVTGITVAGSLPTKFGPMWILERDAAGGPGRSCAGFARTFPDVPLQIAGWHCDALPKPELRSAIACALDQLTLLSAGGDSRLAGVFARAELKRAFCGQRRPSLAAYPNTRTHWIDATPDPALRGRVAAR